MDPSASVKPPVGSYLFLFYDLVRSLGVGVASLVSVEVRSLVSKRAKESKTVSPHTIVFSRFMSESMSTMSAFKPGLIMPT